MKIEHTLKRFALKPGDPDGSFIEIGAVKYHFAPVNPADKASPQVANVEVETHQAIFLNQNPVVFVPYDGAEKVAAPAAPAPRSDQTGSVNKSDVGPSGSGHPDMVKVRLDAPDVALTAVIARAIQVMEISVDEWNAMAETARFQAVEDVISKERKAEADEKAAFERLQDQETDGAEKLNGAPEDSNTPAKPLEEMHLNKLRALGKQYGITDAATMKTDELVKALKPFIDQK